MFDAAWINMELETAMREDVESPPSTLDEQALAEDRKYDRSYDEGYEDTIVQWQKERDSFGA